MRISFNLRASRACRFRAYLLIESEPIKTYIFESIRSATRASLSWGNRSAVISRETTMRCCRLIERWHDEIESGIVCHVKPFWPRSVVFHGGRQRQLLTVTRISGGITAKKPSRVGPLSRNLNSNVKLHFTLHDIVVILCLMAPGAFYCEFELHWKDTESNCKCNAIYQSPAHKCGGFTRWWRPSVCLSVCLFVCLLVCRLFFPNVVWVQRTRGFSYRLRCTCYVNFNLHSLSLSKHAWYFRKYLTCKNTQPGQISHENTAHARSCSSEWVGRHGRGPADVIP